MSFSVAIRDLGVRKALGQLISNFENPEPALRIVGRTFVGNVLRRFGSEQDPEGRPWAPLSRFTIRKRGSAHPILNVTGAMKGGIRYETGRDFVKIIVPAPGKAHEYGAYQNNVKITEMPRRGILTTDGSKIGEEDRRTVLDVISALVRVGDGLERSF